MKLSGTHFLRGFVITIRQVGKRSTQNVLSEEHIFFYDNWWHHFLAHTGCSMTAVMTVFWKGVLSQKLDFIFLFAQGIDSLAWKQHWIKDGLQHIESELASPHTGEANLSVIGNGHWMIIASVSCQTLKPFLRQRHAVSVCLGPHGQVLFSLRLM